jgi:hypothetical protein
VLGHAEWWACQIGGLELQVDAMIDLHRHKMCIKQATKKSQVITSPPTHALLPPLFNTHGKQIATMIAIAM